MVRSLPYFTNLDSTELHREAHALNVKDFAHALWEIETLREQLKAVGAAPTIEIKIPPGFTLGTQ